MKRKLTEGTTGTILYIAIGIVLAFSINQGLALALSTDMPVVAVESDSMVPAFSKGDILIIQGVSEPEDYQDFLNVGDVIVFSPPGRSVPIVHRLIEKNPDGTFQTRGDANNGQQLPFEKSIKPDEIEGKMITIIPYVGWIKIGITEYLLPNPWVPVVLLVTISFIYYLAKNIRV